MENQIYNIPNNLLHTVDRAYLEQDGENWVSVQWLAVDGSEDDQAGQWVDCWAWLAGDILFLPLDGQSTGSRFGDGTLNPDAGWYSPADGRYAVIFDGTPILLF